MIRGFCSAVIAIAIALGSTGCKKSQSEVIRIGEVGSLTGTDASFGVSTHRGIEMAVREANVSGGIHGKKIELITLDDQGLPNEAVLSLNKLIHQYQVKAVLGEVASTLSIAMASVAQKNQIPMITPSSINSKVTEQGSFIFRVCFVDRFQSKIMSDFALKTLKSKKVAILRDVKSDYSRDSADLFMDYFKKGGGRIVADQTYSGGDVDFKSQLTAIRAAMPDLILIPGYYSEVGLIARQKLELGIQAPMLGGDGWDSPQLTQIGGAALDGSYFVSHFAQKDPAERVQGFVQKYSAEYQSGSPDGLAALGYDAARVLIEALRQTPRAQVSSLSGDEIRKAIASIRDFQGVTGKISIGPDRNAIKAATVFKLQGGGKPSITATLEP